MSVHSSPTRHPDMALNLTPLQSNKVISAAELEDWARIIASNPDHIPHISIVLDIIQTQL